ncbi:hypothetical protein AgCh_021220 [Apium graveolens]
MSFLKQLIDSFFSDPSSSSSSQQSPNSSNTTNNNLTMDGVVSNERAAYKLKGYFDLAKLEIDKAVRAEEWGLLDDAVLHYQNAHRILIEASSTPVPSYISSSEQEKVKTYREKISKWQGQASERLVVLSRRTGGKSINKAQIGAVIRTASSPKKVASRISSGPSGQNTSIKSDTKKAGLEKAKQTLLEMVVLPTKRKDIFTGLRRTSRGLLLFGPPGTGKTMLAKAVASESEATFFNVSASSLTSKWVGEGEKLVRTLFMVAISKKPSVIFIDEIDSIMSTRTSSENEASRRLKSEFLVQFDGVTSNSDDLVIVIGATNKPQELDDAVLRRLVKRIYIPLPDANVRRILFKHKLKGQAFSLPGGDLERLVRETEGYSGSDLQALCQEAAMMPIRELGSKILTIKANQVRSLKYSDFESAMTVIRPSLQKSKWEELEQWNKTYGSN